MGWAGEGEGELKWGGGGGERELEERKSPNTTLMSLVAQSGAGALELELVASSLESPLAHLQVPVGMQYLSAPAILYAFHLVCISRSAHTLCCPSLHPPPQQLRHGLATTSRTCQDECCIAIVRALEGTLPDFKCWILGRVGIIGKMTAPILTCVFFSGIERFFLGLFSSCPSYNIISEEL